MDLAKLKSIFLKIMIGCLIASGMLAVVTVLTGSFNEVFARSLSTILLIALHALVSFGYIDAKEKNSSANELTFFHNATFVLIILSFITSIFGVWVIIGGDLVWKLYATYFVLLFAVLHGETLSKMGGNDNTIDNVVRVNYFFMLLVILLILPVIYFADSSLLGDVYYRILAAAGITDAILTLVAIILNKLYLQKHPKTNPTVFGNTLMGIDTGGANTPQAAPPKKRMNILVVILIGFLGMQLLGSLVFAVIGQQAAKNLNNVDTNKSPTQTTQPVSPPATSTSSGAAYSYESSFTVTNGDSYTCTRPIAGTWTRSSAQIVAGRQESATFSFTPARQYDLATYCSHL